MRKEEKKMYVVCEAVPEDDIRIIEYYDSKKFAQELIKKLYDINFENHCYIILSCSREKLNSLNMYKWINSNLFEAIDY